MESARVEMGSVNLPKDNEHERVKKEQFPWFRSVTVGSSILRSRGPRRRRWNLVCCSSPLARPESACWARVSVIRVACQPNSEWPRAATARAVTSKSARGRRAVRPSPSHGWFTLRLTQVHSKFRSGLGCSSSSDFFLISVILVGNIAVRLAWPLQQISLLSRSRILHLKCRKPTAILSRKFYIGECKFTRSDSRCCCESGEQK